MGDDVGNREFTRQDRQRYREKVRRCLDVFARMLTESKFDFEHPMTGLEIEFNLIDDLHDPLMRNAAVLQAIANPDFQTELGQFNIEINVAPRVLSGLATQELETELRASLNDAEARSRTQGAHIAMIGILPTLAAEHLTSDSVGSGGHDAPLSIDLPRAARTCTSRSTAPKSCPPTPTRSPRRRPARACSSTCRSARRNMPATGMPPRAWPACSWPWARTRHFCWARSSGARPGSRSSSRPPTPGRPS